MARKRPANRLSPHFYRKLKEEILEERNCTCEDCGRSYSMDMAKRFLDLHHIVSRARGGGDVRKNIRLLCHWGCHIIKEHGG